MQRICTNRFGSIKCSMVAKKPGQATDRAAAAVTQNWDETDGERERERERELLIQWRTGTDGGDVCASSGNDFIELPIRDRLSAERGGDGLCGCVNQRPHTD